MKGPSLSRHIYERAVEVVLGLEKGRFVVKSSHYEKPK
jgi:hypothetical protein